jgi:DNA sulfur modification protein DndD
MVIRRLQMRNWGPYAGDHEITFDTPGDGRVIQLIRGENGHGKTHLLRAMVIALQGADGMRIVEPASRPGRVDARLQLHTFLEDALSLGCDQATEPQIRLAIELEDGEDSIRVERSWWFEEGTVDEEDLLVFLNGSPFEPIAADRRDQHLEKQALIRARIPEHVMQFFFFDGEEIKAIAENDPTEEVTQGLDALLGLKLLEDLRADVEGARGRLAKEEAAGKRAVAEIQRLASEVSELEAQEVELTDGLEQLRTRTAAIEAELDELEQHLPRGSQGRSAGDEHRTDIASRIKAREEERDSVRRRISETAATDLAVLYPKNLLAATIRRLAGEERLREWEHQRELMVPECAKLSTRLFGRKAETSEPPLTDDQLDFYRDRLAIEWKNILQPPPKGVPKSQWLTALSSDHLQAAQQRLQSAIDGGAGGIGAAVREDGEIGEQIRALGDRLDNYASDQETRRVVEKIRTSSDLLGQEKRATQELEARLAELAGQLGEKRREHSNRVARSAASAQTREQLAVAHNIIDVVAKFRDQLKRRRVEDLQSDIQQMMARLAHKGEDQFNSVRIDPASFQLSILDADGQMVRGLSAGEREILALSMLWALGKISRRALPIVIDTPLGRLDRRHRSNIVESFLPYAAEQVIVLATDEEITAERRSLLEPTLAGDLELVFDPDSRTTSVRRSGASVR